MIKEGYLNCDLSNGLRSCPSQDGNRFSFCVQPEVFTPVHVNSTTGLTKGVHLSVPQIDFPVISHDSALEALQRFIKSHMCCHRSVLKNLRILHESVSYYYGISLDSILENRSVCWKMSNSTPLSSVPVDPWSIEMPVPDASVEQTVEKTVPHIVAKHVCPTCENRADLPNCATCGGRGFVSRCMDIRSHFYPHCNRRTLNRSGLDSSLLEDVSAHLVYEASGTRIIPDNLFLDKELNTAVKETCREAEEWARDHDAAIRRQRLYISVVPIRILDCCSGKKTFQATVYGHDLRVFCTDFPQHSLSSIFCSFLRSFQFFVCWIYVWGEF